MQKWVERCPDSFIPLICCIVIIGLTETGQKGERHTEREKLSFCEINIFLNCTGKKTSTNMRGHKIVSMPVPYVFITRTCNIHVSDMLLAAVKKGLKSIRTEGVEERFAVNRILAHI